MHRRKPVSLVAFAMLAAALHPPVAEAQFQVCRSIADDRERLACYDHAAAATPSAAAAPQPGVEGERRELGALSDEQAAQAERRRRLGASLTDRWELDDSNRRGTFLLRPYKPMYFLLANRTDHTNDTPSSPSPDHTLSDPAALRKVEAKFQISLKAKVKENLFPNNGDLWLGYTQSSRWQVYNSQDSAPFRETNYEPEAMLVFRTHYDLFGLKGRMIGLGINHQSNGRPLPLSRSWNRITADFGFERDDWMIVVRPWWRIKETADKDDNPGIEDYIGRGELLVARKHEGHVFSLIGRHSLRGGPNSRGSIQFDWGIPISSYLKAHLQLFTGYGESLIDYNHRQTTVGLGVSLVDWF